MICLGAANLKYGENIEEIYTDLCIGKSSEIQEIRRIRTQNIDQIMCTSRCPCWSGFQISEEIATTYKKPIDSKINEKFFKDTRSIVSKWTGYKGLDETYLNKFNRTSSSNARVVKAGDGETEYVMAPFVWADYIYDKEGEQVAYRSFKECFEKNLLPNGFLQEREISNVLGQEKTLEEDYSKKTDFYKANGLFTYFSQLEKEFECNSICEPNLFYIHQEL
jgi:hypothetical protein